DGEAGTRAGADGADRGSGPLGAHGGYSRVDQERVGNVDDADPDLDRVEVGLGARHSPDEGPGIGELTHDVAQLIDLTGNAGDGPVGQLRGAVGLVELLVLLE